MVFEFVQRFGDAKGFKRHAAAGGELGKTAPRASVTLPIALTPADRVSALQAGASNVANRGNGVLRRQPNSRHHAGARFPVQYPGAQGGHYAKRRE